MSFNIELEFRDGANSLEPTPKVAPPSSGLSGTLAGTWAGRDAGGVAWLAAAAAAAEASTCPDMLSKVGRDCRLAWGWDSCSRN